MAEAAGEEQEPMLELTLKIGCGMKLGDGSEEWPSRVGFQFPGEEADLTTEQKLGGDPEYEFEQVFRRPLAQETYDMLASTEITANVYTTVGEGKEAHEEVYASVGVQLVDLLQGAVQVGGVLEVKFPVKEDEEPVDEPEEMDPDDPDYEPPQKPVLEVSISIGEPLFGEEEVADSNFLSVNAGKSWSLPPKWVETDGKDTLDSDLFDYTLSMVLPVGGVDTPLEIGQGKLVLPVPKEGDEAAADGDEAAAEAAEVPAIQDDPRAASENEDHPRIEWSFKRCFFMTGAAMEKLKEMAEEETPVVVRFSRTITAELADGGWIDQNQPKYSGDVEVDISRMILPGVTAAEGRMAIHPCIHPMDKPEEPGKTKKPPPCQLNLEEGVPPAEENGGIFQLSGSYIQMSLELAQPIYPRPPTPRRPSIAPGDLVPPRPPLPRFQQPKDAAIELQKMVKDTVNQLVSEYRQQYPGAPSTSAEMHKDFMYFLSKTGKYHSFKEKLKKAVVRVVREKFKKDGTESAEDMANFYNDLYVYLMENTMQAINTTFEKESRDSEYVNPVPEVGSVESYIRLAEEAEIALDLEEAAKWRQECIVMADSQPSLWHDYGLFALRAHDMTKAEECLRESLSLQTDNVLALTVYAVNLAMRESYEEAEAFLQGAIDLEPNMVVCWAIRGLLFDLVDRPEDAKHCFMQATIIQKDIDTGVIEATAACPKTYEQKEGVFEISNTLAAGAGHLQAAKFLLDLHATSLAEKALQLANTVTGRSVPTFCCFARLYMQRQDYVRAEENIQEALTIDSESLEAWTLLAHSQFLQKQSNEAIASYEKALKVRAEPMDNAVYLRLGQLLLDNGGPEQLERAKQVFLKACTTFSTASSWLGVGIACYMRGQYDQAEEALVEANIADNQNGVVWAYICLTCMQLKRDDEADTALQYALQRGVDRAVVLQELGAVYVAAGKPTVAEGALRRSLLLRDDATVRVGLADAVAAQGKHDDAICEYLKVVDNKLAEDEKQRIHALEQLVEMFKTVNRPEDAKKYSKMLRKSTIIKDPPKEE